MPHSAVRRCLHVQLIFRKARTNSLRHITITTCRHIACRFGNDEIVSILLRSGAKPALVDAEGHTALHFAAVNGHLQCAKTLLEAGADPFVKAGVSNRIMENGDGGTAGAAVATAASTAEETIDDARVPATAQEMAHDAGQVAMDRML